VLISRQNIARKALADFFAAVEVQRAHWCSIKEAKDGALFKELNLDFPPLSLLLSVRKELLMLVEETVGPFMQMKRRFITITTCMGGAH